MEAAAIKPETFKSWANRTNNLYVQVIAVTL